MAYQPGKPVDPVDNYSMLQWFDPQAQQNAPTADWQRQWNAANFGTQGTGQDWGDGLLLGPGQAPPTSKDGTWVLTQAGQQMDRDGGQGGAPSMANRYSFIPNQPKSAPAMQQQPEEPAPQQAAPTNGKTIYNDWDTYQNKARADVEGINRMPFAYSDYAGISLDPDKAMQQFYPSAWQEGGVQKTIGPNGQNIAPYLQSDFDSAQFLKTNGTKDFPSLVGQLLNSGTIDQRQQQALLELMKPKKPDTSFANQMMANK